LFACFGLGPKKQYKIKMTGKHRQPIAITTTCLKTQTSAIVRYTMKRVSVEAFLQGAVGLGKK